jgi:hypothetical protein
MIFGGKGTTNILIPQSIFMMIFGERSGSGILNNSYDEGKCFLFEFVTIYDKPLKKN